MQVLEKSNKSKRVLLLEPKKEDGETDHPLTPVAKHTSQKDKSTE